MELRRERLPLQQVTFGPLRLLDAMPWLVMAAAMRVIATSGGPAAPIAVIVASITVLLAFLTTARRSIEAARGQTSLGDLDFNEQCKLSLSLLWRIGLLMIVAAFAFTWAGYPVVGSNMLVGLDGMAFDQLTAPGKFWSALIAILVLLMVIRAEHQQGRVAFFAAVRELARRGLWLGAAVVALGAIYLGLGFIQGIVRGAIWNFWQASTINQTIKNLIYFVFIFSFAMLRLWITLLMLTFALRQSYVRGD